MVSCLEGLIILGGANNEERHIKGEAVERIKALPAACREAIRTQGLKIPTGALC